MRLYKTALVVYTILVSLALGYVVNQVVHNQPLSAITERN